MSIIIIIIIIIIIMRNSNQMLPGYSVWARKRVPKFLVTLGPASSLIWGRGWPPKHAGSSPYVLPYKIWSLWIKVDGRRYGSQQFLDAGARPLGRGRVQPPRNTLLLAWVTTANFRSNFSYVIKQIPRNSLILRFPPFKVTQGHWNRHGSIGSRSFLLATHRGITAMLPSSHLMMMMMMMMMISRRKTHAYPFGKIT